ncbi:putative Flp pilus assembly protein TadG [Desulfosarcina cetonica]|nr:putative Flp pilus assembly protein TadG [Desulfosarcina cetonica]
MISSIAPFLPVEQRRVGDAAGDGAGGSGGRAHQVDHAALAHAAVEIAVGGRRADFTLGQHAVAHAQAGPAGGVGHAKAGIHEDLDQAFFQGLGIDLRRGRRDDGAHVVADALTAQHLGGNAQVADATVGARADIDLVHRCAGHFSHRLDVVRLVAEGDHGRKGGNVMVDGGAVDRVRVGQVACEISQGRLGGVVLILDEGPQVIHRGTVRFADAAGPAGFDGHVAKGHARFHVHGRHHRAGEFDHLVGGAVHPDAADYRENHVLGIDALGQVAGDVDAHGLGGFEGADPLEDAHFQVGGAHAGGKGAKGAVGAGVGIAHDHRVSRAHEAFFGKDGVADTVGANVEEILDGVAVGPGPQNLALQGGLGVLGRRDMVDDHLDSVGIEDAVLVAPFQIQDGRWGGDFVAEDRVQADHVHVRIRRADTMVIEDFLCNGSTHGSSVDAK